MIDFAVTLSALAIGVAAALLIWRRASGPAASPWRASGRVLLALALVLPAVAFATYRLTRSRTFQLAGEIVARVDTDRKVVALTFDDGPTPVHTQEVLGMLDEGGAKATFYLTGAESEENPDELRAIVEAGHELGNHTYSHRRMYFLRGGRIADEIERTDALFADAGYEGPTTFRPPGCKRLLSTPLYLRANSRATVTWDLEPDSVAGVAEDADAIVDYVVDRVRPGSIVLMHVMYDSREPTREALPKVLERLAGKGYRFVTVSELLSER